MVPVHTIAFPSDPFGTFAGHACAGGASSAIGGRTDGARGLRVLGNNWAGRAVASADVP